MLASSSGSGSKATNGDKPANGEVKQRKRPGRVPVSCAECRRLKLRCDRKIPCETCVKRGCSAICPEGSLTTGKGNRLAFADADELQKKVERLRNRVSVLEDALRTLQAAVSDDPHPLLQDGAFEEKDGTTRPTPPAGGPSLSREEEEFLDAFGTLTLGLRGESRFFGQTSRSEYLIHAPEYVPVCDPAMFPHLSAELVQEACGGMEFQCRDMEIKRQILQHLPSLSRACRLCDIFIEYGEYLWCALPRNQLFDEILGVIYRSTAFTDEQNNLLSTHAISLLYMVFALAALFDMDLPPYSMEAVEYYLLARAALRFAPPLHNTTLWAIQTMIYMVTFMELSDCHASHAKSHKAWINAGIAVKLGHGIGLHVNGKRWKLDPDSSQRRSSVFWQLFHLDTWVAFGFGRPPSMSLAYVDCELPKDPEEYVDENGHKEWGYHSWTWQYSKLLHTVMTTAFGSKNPQYSTVIELDRKVRDFPIPFRMRIKCGDPSDLVAVPLSLRYQRWTVMACKESTLLNLHRPYFAQALNEQPQDLLRHRYGPSVMAIYRSGWRLIEGLREIWKHVPQLMCRLSLPWSQCLSAAIVMCLLVTRAPTSPLAPASLQELDRVCELFEEAVDKSVIAHSNLIIVQKLRRQGHDVVEKSESHDMTDTSDLELDRFGGKTHLMAAHPQPKEVNGGHAAFPAGLSTPSTDASGSPGIILPESIHPTIMQDMRAFDGSVLDFSSWMSGTNTASAPAFDMSQTVNQTNHNGMQTQHQQQALLDPAFLRPFSEVYFSEELFAAAAPSVASTDTNVGPPPVLDATWQSFVEQLGF